MSGIASTPEPPYVAVIFTSLLADDDGYAAVAEHLGAQHLGQEQWYRACRVRAAVVQRDYGMA